MANGESIYIREVQGPDRMEAELDGSAMPEAGLGVETEQHLVQTHYPGAHVAHTQVLGPRYRPIVLRGRLRDVWLGAAGAAQMARVRLEAMVRRGRLCDLSWGETVVARGRIRRVQCTLQSASDIDYELEFLVDATDVPRAMAIEPFPAHAEDLHQHMSALQAFGKVLDGVLAINNVIRAVF